MSEAGAVQVLLSVAEAAALGERCSASATALRRRASSPPMSSNPNLWAIRRWDSRAS